MNLIPRNSRTLVLILVLCGCMGCAGARGPKSPAESKPVKPLEVLRNKESRVQWDPASAIEADFDQDGTKDAALLGFRRDAAVVGIVQGPMSPRSRTWTLEFGWKGGGQHDLCSKEVGIDLERLEELESPEEIPLQGMGINLHDDRCDAFHIFWDPETQRFDWWRL
ncbi:MAG TPA: hypothetical protein VG477_03850 [Thermoanaerobaculia bacterium]|nr:hypothetical protein [Thermoanaerobaculia bacterium]